MVDMNETLAQRHEQYGDFLDISVVAQKIKKALHDTLGWEEMPFEQREALDNISTKMARIVIGNCDHVDNWHDIAGYATLVERKLLT